MSKVLVIRHLPTTLSFHEKEQLLKHFGAENVWETSTKRHYVFASFGTVQKAKASLIRLHQLELAHRRLVVEYSSEKAPVKQGQQDTENISTTTRLVKEFLHTLNAWNPSVNFYQPPPVHLNYKYPDINPEIAINIIHALFTHKPFYVQVLHLMNKMCLDVPFQETVGMVIFFKNTFKKYFTSDDVKTTIPQQESEPETEISSDESDQKKLLTPKLIRRKRKLPVPSRKVLPLPIAPKVKKSSTNQKEVFETVTPIQEPKKILLVVHQDALQKPVEEPDVIGELGKFEKEEQPVQNQVKITEVEKPTITKKQLLENRISYSDMKILPIFKNYHPGQPSMRLYIKNIAKTVSEQDVNRIYKRYVEGLTEEEQIGFDVRVMQEGRMKGQAFVTFPSVRIAETALNETNGYLLKDKPIVVQFARVANKKIIE